MCNEGSSMTPYYECGHTYTQHYVDHCKKSFEKGRLDPCEVTIPKDIINPPQHTSCPDCLGTNVPSDGEPDVDLDELWRQKEETDRAEEARREAEKARKEAEAEEKLFEGFTTFSDDDEGISERLEISSDEEPDKED